MGADILAHEKAASAIRKRIKELGLSQPKVSRMVGKSASWLATQVLPNPEGALRYLWAKEPETFRRLLNALQWTPEEFSQATGIRFPSPVVDSSSFIPTTRYRMPIIEAGAGPPMWNENAEYITLDLPELRGKGERELFAVRVKGDSMEPTLTDRDVVVFWTEGAPEPGRVVAVHVHWDGVVIKRLQRYNGSWYLYSDNPAHPPLPLGEHDRILGVAVNLVRRI